MLILLRVIYFVKIYQKLKTLHNGLDFQPILKIKKLDYLFNFIIKYTI